MDVNATNGANGETKTKKRRVRTGRKRTDFKTTPRPAWPVRGLWESAPQAERDQAHRTCMLILEYWLGKKTKSAVAEELSVKPLRVWQLSQQALSGMLAGLLTQPRRRVGREVFERCPGQSLEAMKQRIASLETELARTEDLVRVLRTAPWASPSTESSPKEAPTRAKRSRRTATKKPTNGARGAPASRKDPAREEPLEGGASCAG